MLAGELPAKREALELLAERLQPSYEVAWNEAVKRFENLLIYGTTHPEAFFSPEELRQREEEKNVLSGDD